MKHIKTQRIKTLNPSKRYFLMRQPPLYEENLGRPLSEAQISLHLSASEHLTKASSLIFN